MHCSFTRTFGRFPQMDCEIKNDKKCARHVLIVRRNGHGYHCLVLLPSPFCLCDYIMQVLCVVLRAHVCLVIPLLHSVTAWQGDSLQEKGHTEPIDCSVDASLLPSAAALSKKKNKATRPHTTQPSIGYSQTIDFFFKFKTSLKEKKKEKTYKKKCNDLNKKLT